MIKEESQELVFKNNYGNYELKHPLSVQTCESYYSNEYYQNNKAMYAMEYSIEELENKRFKLQEKAYILKNLLSISYINGNFFDIGSGEGFALKYFSDEGFCVRGVDLSSHGCAQQNPSMLQFMTKGDAEIEISKYERNSFRGILHLDHILEHVQDSFRLIQQITNIAQKGSALVISVPNDFSQTQLKALESGLIEDEFWVNRLDHISYFNKSGLQNMVESCGWHMEYIMGSYPIDFNLYNEDTNYVKNKSVGKSCYNASLSIEKLMYESSFSNTVDIYHKLGEMGLGREIIEYFIL